MNDHQWKIEAMCKINFDGPFCYSVDEEITTGLDISHERVIRVLFFSDYNFYRFYICN